MSTPPVSLFTVHVTFVKALCKVEHFSSRRSFSRDSSTLFIVSDGLTSRLCHLHGFGMHKFVMRYPLVVLKGRASI